MDDGQQPDQPTEGGEGDEMPQKAAPRAAAGRSLEAGVGCNAWGRMRLCETCCSSGALKIPTWGQGAAHGVAYSSMESKEKALGPRHEHDLASS